MKKILIVAVSLILCIITCLAPGSAFAVSVCKTCGKNPCVCPVEKCHYCGLELKKCSCSSCGICGREDCLAFLASDGYAHATFYVDGVLFDYSDVIELGFVYDTSPIHLGANPTKYNYTFVGWSPVIPSSGLGGEYAIRRNAVFEYNVVTYTVTFVDWDNTVLKTATVNSGGNATAPALPTRSGYICTGWSGAFSNVTSNLTITAIYVTAYIITYDANGGTYVD